MIHIEDYAKMLSGELEIVKQQTADLTHADSLLQPQPGGNCLNWVMGHLVVNLAEILRVIGGQVPESLPDLNHYGHGSEPIKGEEEGVLPLLVLLETYNLLTTAVNDRLSEMNDDDFEEEIDFWQGKTRRGYVAFFYFFHNSYHVGQLEQFRNLAGKTEKVI
ncbi:MAG: DinB family protein [Anaerolineales bacterium]|jgi:hypothetical protein